MFRLDPECYGRVRPLFAGLRTNLVVDSIMDGHTPAWVYVDDFESPRTGWMWDLQGEMFVAGEAGCAATNRALAGLIVGQAIPQAQGRGIPGLALFCDHAAWEEQLDVILPGFEPKPTPRRRYAFDRPKFDWRGALPASGRLYRLDAHWLGRRDLHGMDCLVGWVDSFWHTHDDFLRASFGFFALEGNAVASWCLGVFVSGRQVELGVATVPDDRGRGLATAVAARSVAFCVDRGLTPHWHCWENNVASWRIAEKIGFVDPTFYTVHHIDIER